MRQIERIKGYLRMKIISDVAQKANKHKLKEFYWQQQGIEVEKLPLPVGDYILVDERVQDVLDRKAKRGMAVKKMDFLGSYKVCVDTKESITEICGNVCGKSHARFRDECILAQNNGIQLYILVENEGKRIRGDIWNKTITRLEDLHSWVNPRLFVMKNGKQVYPTATKGATLQKACETMEKKYGVKFLFCSKKDAGRIVVELLTKGEGNAD
jgi:ribosome-associated protein